MSSTVADLREAVARHQAGDLSQAERLYRAVLQDNPQHGDALHLLGVLAHQSGEPATAIDLIDRAIRHTEPPQAAMYCNLGAAYQTLRDFERAILHYQHALHLQPQYADARHNLATARAAQGNHEQAVSIYQDVLTAHPGHRAAQLNLGKSLQTLGRLTEAVTCYQRVVEDHPGDIEALLNLGTVHALSGQHDRAAECFQKLLQQAPQHPQAHFNLGRIRQDQGRLADAVAHYQQAVRHNPGYVDAWNNLGVTLKSLKQFDEAADCFARIVALAPNSATAHFNLGNVRRAQELHRAAVDSYRRGLQIAPDHIECYLNLGTALTALGDFTAAEEAYRTALTLRPHSIEAHLNLASTLQLQGRLDAAAEIYDHAAAIDPSCAAVQSNALMLPLYRPEISPHEILRRHRQWGARLEETVIANTNFQNDRNPERRLRIGYVSPDLRIHPVGFFMETILQHHNRQQLDVTCYADHADDDRMTARIRPLVDRWRSTFRRTDEAVCQMILDDEIDILIDLAGHTSGNRLPIFAHRPAPVQMTYLGYGTTTGLSTIDYRLTDAVADPPHEPCEDAEERLRLPGGILCYAPPLDAPAVSPPPMFHNSFVTFGSFNNLSKLSEPTLDAWASVLRTVPGSRMLLKNRSFADADVRSRFVNKFANRGITADRLELVGPTASIAEHLSLYGRIDLALDSFPYNGATTTCEALWMGVPVVTLRGSAFVGRMTASLLTTAGLTDFIAETPNDFIDVARRWADSPEQLSELRQNLRQIVGHSPLCDARVYVRELEEIYRSVWRRWCSTSPMP